MAKQRNALSCSGCGASSPLPADPTALAFDCQYCGNHQLLPQQVVEQRRAQIEKQRAAAEQRRLKQQREWAAEQRRIERELASEADDSSDSGGVHVLVVLGIILVGSGLIVGLVFAIINAVDERISPPVELIERPREVEPAKPSPPPPPPLPEESEDNNGLATIRARMAELHEAGCNRVLTPPTRYTRGIEMTAVFGNSGCVVMLGATQMPETTVRLEAHDGHGNPMDTPAAAPAFEWRHCPKLEGEHRMKIVHEGRGPYHLAAYDCPKRRFDKLPPVAPPFAEPAAEDSPDTAGQ
ncbi:MAG: hypothetical protein R6X02_10890 [Enhygromyxa sp.]